MKLSNLFTITSILSLVFGLVFVVVPVQAISYYGATLGVGGAIMTQFYGAALIGIGVIAWYAREAEDSSARTAIVTGFFAAEALTFVVAVKAQLIGSANELGWTTVAISFLLAAGFGYFRFVKN